MSGECFPAFGAGLLERMNSDDRANISYYDTLAGEYELFFSDLDRNMEQEGTWLSTVLKRYGAKTDPGCFLWSRAPGGSALRTWFQRHSGRPQRSHVA